MKRFMVLAVLCIGAFLLGCGLVHTKEERIRRIKNINDLQTRMQVDDWDYFWLYDRPSYLTWYPVREAD